MRKILLSTIAFLTLSTSSWADPYKGELVTYKGREASLWIVPVPTGEIKMLWYMDKRENPAGEMCIRKNLAKFKCTIVRSGMEMGTMFMLVGGWGAGPGIAPCETPDASGTYEMMKRKLYHCWRLEL